MSQFDNWQHAYSDATLTTKIGRKLPKPHGCKGICDLHLECINILGPGKLELLMNGWKNCRTCEKCIKTTERFCPCCKRILSVMPNLASARRKLLEMKGIKRY